MDGTHINCCASAEMCQAAHDQIGGVTQNCLAICGFDIIFSYIFSGWDGSAADSAMFYNACITDLHISADKYYLADAGFPICDALLIPECGVQHHLAEWGWAQQWLVIVTGNPGVSQGYLYPYPCQPVPANNGRGHNGLG